MKYCVPYMTNTLMWKTADEVIIFYSDALDFTKLEKFSNQQMILDISEAILLENLEKIDIFLKKFPNARLRVNAIKSFNTIANHYPNRFFFSTIAFDWDTFTYLRSFHPTDIYIGGNLGFDLKNVATVAAYDNLSIRAYPCIPSNGSGEITGLVTDFYVRPEDIPVYDKYIQVFEFPDFGIRTQAFYDIYKGGKGYNLKNIIYGLNTDIYSEFLPPAFGFYRVSCKKKCQQDRCEYCKTAVDFANIQKEIADASSR